MPWTDEQRDTPLAELELFGLSCRLCNMLEADCQAIYVRDLLHIKCETLASIPYFGPKGIQQVQEALRNFHDGRQVKTIEECLGDNEDG